LKTTVAALMIVMASFIALVLFTKAELGKLGACGADPLCQLSVVCEYTLVVVLAVSIVLVLVDAVIQLGGQPERKLSLYPHTAWISAGGRVWARLRLRTSSVW
jgi:hypothetical protein